ncbi:MAG: hypothetical protein IT282_01395 [Bacteroidetes bacterium]|nr:hypothetical protein [Bacteroidota bacterium]
MLRKRFRKAFGALCFGLPLFCVALLYEVKVHQSIITVFEVYPLQKWILTKGEEAPIISAVTDYRAALSNEIHVFQFERGESMEFRLVPSVKMKTSVARGDTIAVLGSSRIRERLAELKGALNVARADLAVRRAGEKQPVVEEESQRVEHAAARIQEKKILFERAQELYKKGYVSREEFDAAQWQLKEAELEHGIHRAALQASLTGSKAEELQMVRAMIASYRGEIALLESRLQSFILLAPIPGDVVRSFSVDTLFTVSNCSCAILHAPIRCAQAHHLTEGESLCISLKNVPGETTGVLVDLAKRVDVINGVQVRYARIALERDACPLLPGLTVGGEIILPRVRASEYLLGLLTGR